MAENDPQLGINGLLPELIPDEQFRDPLHAKFVANWWTHPELGSLSDAIAPTVATLSADESLKFAQKIDEDYLSEAGGCGIHGDSVWWQFRDLSVDEEGIVRAVIGHISDVRAFFEYPRSESADYAIDQLCEDLRASIYDAALEWRGEEFAEELERQVELEELRRNQQNNPYHSSGH